MILFQYEDKRLAANSEFFYQDVWSNLEHILCNSSSNVPRISTNTLDYDETFKTFDDTKENAKNALESRTPKMVVTPKPNIVAKSLLPSDFFNS
mmetsp:Transcript_14774/g.18268  ORF Transcript_14774/g.18268 Transcript_14774/m.18268 type:complete len:94 (-) Transcript_14774:1130-1411(-)